MGRLPQKRLERVESFCDRVLTVSTAIERQGRSIRIIDQLIGSGTSVGANLFEADECVTRPEFRRCLAIALRELNETRFWLRLIARQSWLKPSQLRPLEQECAELKKILGAMVVRTASRDRSALTKPVP